MSNKIEVHEAVVTKDSHDRTYINYDRSTHYSTDEYIGGYCDNGSFYIVTRNKNKVLCCKPCVVDQYSALTMYGPRIITNLFFADEFIVENNQTFKDSIERTGTVDAFDGPVNLNVGIATLYVVSEKDFVFLKNLKEIYSDTPLKDALIIEDYKMQANIKGYSR